MVANVAPRHDASDAGRQQMVTDPHCATAPAMLDGSLAQLLVTVGAHPYKDKTKTCAHTTTPILFPNISSSTEMDSAGKKVGNNNAHKWCVRVLPEVLRKACNQPVIKRTSVGQY